MLLRMIYHSEIQTMSKETIRNRYGDEFTFTLLEDGNIQWEGNFDYHRVMLSDGIKMVDPSGGPCLTEGDDILGKTIKEFKPNEKGYLIITK